MALALTMSLPTTAQTKRHHAKKATVSMVSKGDTVGITAYSDTTSAASAAADSLTSVQPAKTTKSHTFTFTDADDPFTLMAYLGTLGVSGVFIALFCVLFLLLIIGSPLILVALIVYWLVRRKRVEYKLAEKAIENGQPVPNGVLRQQSADREQIWQKGIKNAALGLGIIIFGAFFSDFFIAVGAIFICWGVGQCVIARTSANGNKPVAANNDLEETATESHTDGATE